MSQIESERGSILLEALVSGILLVITAVGVFSAFEAGNRASAEERHRAQAEGLAQTDVTRMRTMRISDLSNLHESKTVTIEKTPYTVESRAEYETDKTGTASCEKGTSSADYIQIRSTITWPSMGSRAPVVVQSLVAPPNGSITEDSGALAVQVEDAEGNGVEGVGLTGTGPASFSGETGETGCVIFGNLPEGNNYTLTSTIIGASLVNPNGEAPGPQTTSVVGESTNTVTLQYGEAGEAEVSFTTTINGIPGKPSSADAVVVYNSGMEVARVFGTPGTRQAVIKPSALFPFTSPYSIYAGSCTEDNPGESAPEAAIADVEVPPGGKALATIQLPPLNLTVRNGKSSSPGSPLSGAKVKITDTKCEGKGGQTQIAFTDAEGHLPDPGLPYSTYKLCAYSSVTNRRKTETVTVPASPAALEAGTTLTIYLGTTASGVSTGECP
jgi:Tfp pilus assembly protein PilV